MQELKRCPFCGSEGEYQQYGNEHIGVTKSAVVCKSCGVQQVCKWKIHKFDFEFIRQKTIDRWNRRTENKDDGWNQVKTLYQNYIPDTRLVSVCKPIQITYQTENGRRYVKQVLCNRGRIEKKVNGDIIAWRPLPEPYKLERRAGE